MLHRYVLNGFPRTLSDVRLLEHAEVCPRTVLHLKGSGGGGGDGDNGVGDEGVVVHSYADEFDG